MKKVKQSAVAKQVEKVKQSVKHSDGDSDWDRTSDLGLMSPLD